MSDDQLRRRESDSRIDAIASAQEQLARQFHSLERDHYQVREQIVEIKTEQKLVLKTLEGFVKEFRVHDESERAWRGKAFWFVITLLAGILAFLAEPLFSLAATVPK